MTERRRTQGRRSLYLDLERRVALDRGADVVEHYAPALHPGVRLERGAWRVHADAQHAGQLLALHEVEQRQGPGEARALGDAIHRRGLYYALEPQRPREVRR